eukprot:scaffold374_cov94-Skeletonema_dohrnii-CCMP3373.AAC.1
MLLATDLLDLFIDLILKHAGIGSGADDGSAIDLSGLQDDVPSGVFAPSPSGAVTTVDQSNDNETEDKSKVMPYATVKSNTTPGQGQDVYVPSQWFEERSKTCDGVYWGKRLKSLENSRSTQPETATCHVCKRDTAWYCFGCNRYLCNIPPQQKNGGGRSTAKKNGGKKNAKANENGKANGKRTTTTKKKKKSSAKKAKGKGKKQSGDDEDDDDDGKKKKSVKELNKEKAAERKNTKKMKHAMLSKYPKRFTTNVPVKGMASTLAITLHTWSVGNNAATSTQLKFKEKWRESKKKAKERKRKEEEEEENQKQQGKRKRRKSSIRPDKPNPLGKR